MLPRTYRSYWLVTHSLEPWLGLPSSASSVSAGSVASTVVGTAWRAGSSAGCASGRSYTGPSWATVRGGTSTTVSPCHSMTKRSPSVTSPITVAVTPHFSQIARNASRLAGVTTAHIRSCDSLIRISSGVRLASRKGTRSSQTCIPPSPLLAISEVAQLRPAPPRSWIPSTSPAWSSSSEHSMSSFSVKGSPTCTAGRLLGPPSSKLSEASTLTPPMPSPPVNAPYRITRLPAPRALDTWMSSWRIAPTHSALTSGFVW